jgi:acyl carrier protein
MDPIAEVREFLGKLLLAKGDRQPFTDTTSFFLSGRLASVEAVELVVLLENKFGLDFADTGIDESQIDTIEAIQSLVQTTKTPK